MSVHPSMHRRFLDRDTLIERATDVAIIADSLRHDAAWEHAGASARGAAARRIDFARWLAEAGEINESM
jgi:hypothetical protein